MNTELLKSQLTKAEAEISASILEQSKLQGIIEEKKRLAGTKIEELAAKGIVIDKSSPKASAAAAIAALEEEINSALAPIADKYGLTQ